MISIDTSTMQQLVQAASTANSAIDQAMEILNRISSHNDWACKEKDAINDYTTNNKKRARQLHENAQSFFNAVKCVSVDFETAETDISDMFSSVESLLAGVLQVAQGAVSNVIDGVQTGVSTVQSVLDTVLDKIGIETPADSYWENHPDSEIVPIIGEIPSVGFPTGGLVPPTPFRYPKSDLNLFSNLAELESFSLHNFTEPIPMCKCSDIQMWISE